MEPFNSQDTHIKMIQSTWLFKDESALGGPSVPSVARVRVLTKTQAVLLYEAQGLGVAMAGSPI
jgi:hypothetical protein